MGPKRPRTTDGKGRKKRLSDGQRHIMTKKPVIMHKNTLKIPGANVILNSKYTVKILTNK